MRCADGGAKRKPGRPLIEGGSNCFYASLRRVQRSGEQNEWFSTNSPPETPRRAVDCGRGVHTKRERRRRVL